MLKLNPFYGIYVGIPGMLADLYLGLTGMISPFTFMFLLGGCGLLSIVKFEFDGRLRVGGV